MAEQKFLSFFNTEKLENATEWEKRTGFTKTDYQAGYRGDQYSPYCFQRQLRDQKDDGYRAGLDGEVRRITYQEAKHFILQYEWLGSMGATDFCFGFFINRKLTCVLCFGRTTSTNNLSEPFGEKWKKQGTILIRGACAPWAHPHTASHVMSEVFPIVREMGYRFVIAYSDPEAGEIGTVYQATNWNFYGLTSPVSHLLRPDGKRIDEKRVRDYAKKAGVSNAEMKQKFIDEGFKFMMGTKKLKYMKLLGNKKDQREIMKDCRVTFYPYLKRRDDMREVYTQFDENLKEVKEKEKLKKDESPFKHGMTKKQRKQLEEKLKQEAEQQKTEE